MNKVLLAAVAATLLAAPAGAQNSRPRRVAVAHVSAPSHAAASGSAPTYYGTTPVAPGQAAQPNQPSAAGINLALTAAQTMYQGMNGGGHAAPTTTRGLYAGGGGHYVFHDSSFWGRRVDAPQAPQDAPTGTSGNGVPSVIMPGQLMRTAGLGALVSQPDAAPSTFAVEAGNRITYQDNKGYALTTAPGVFTGPKDTLPPPNPTSGGSSGAGGNGITENNNVTNISHSGNGAGNTTGSGNTGGGTQNGN